MSGSHVYEAIKWNFENAFVGQLSSMPAPEESKPFLPFNHFLAVPLLRIDEDNFIYTKFCGNLGVCENDTEMSDVLSAFVHFTYVQSKGTIAFSDLQGKSISL